MVCCEGECFLETHDPVFRGDISVPLEQAYILFFDYNWPIKVYILDVKDAGENNVIPTSL